MNKKGEQFGQRRPPLSVTIKQILERYPDGQIFKEMIQNADDAGATKIQFYVDCRQHGTSGLVTPQLKAFQGPALVSANDAMFSEQDWEGIQNLQQSIKADDPFKVGRFGIGFNSVYHLTDVPSIISGGKIAFLEPQEKIWEGQSGRWFSLDELIGSDNLNAFDDIADYKSQSRHYAKTLFRFPLRTAASNLSENVYTINKVNELIEALRCEAKLLLLFLRSIHTIEVYDIDHHGRKTLTFQTRIADAHLASVNQKRQQLLAQLKSCHTSQQYDFSNVIQFTAKFDVCVYDAKIRQTTTSHWCVANQVGSSNATVRAASVKQKVFPWVGTAVELDDPGNGRIFCFLPMPIETASNLPVHVNGTFGLNDDRRSLKWPGVERRNDPMANWNQMLVKDVLPSCYAQLLLEAKAHLNSKNFYKAWPNVQKLKHSQWESLLSPVLSGIMRDRVIWTTHTCEWVQPSTAVYKPRSGTLIDVVEDILTACGVKLAEVPANVWGAFEYTRVAVTEVKPSFMRDKLRANPRCYSNISQSNKRDLLRYCLSDGQYCNNELRNLNLLPLANGTFTAFQANSYMIANVYMCTTECPKHLLPGLDHKLVDLSGDYDLHTILVQVAQSNATQVRVLDVSAVARLLDEALPAQWRSSGNGTMPNSQIPSGWFEKFWKWVRNKQLDIFQNKVIVPVRCANKPVSRQFSVIKLATSQPVLFIPSYSGCSATMLSVLDQFGIQYCTQTDFPYLDHRHLANYIKTYSPNAVLEVIALKNSYKSVTLTSEQAECLRNTFAQIRLSLTDRSVLKYLRIFSSCANSSNNLYSVFEVSKKSSLVKVILQPSNCIDMSVLPSNMIVFSSGDYYQNQLLKQLGFAASNGVDFLTQSVFPCIHQMGDAYIDKIMTKVLDMYQTLCYSNSSITASIQYLKFVKVAHGVRKCPHQLFDPCKEDIGYIFLGETVHPAAPYNESKYIDVLRCCGLRTSVTPQEILDVIFSISQPESSYPQQVDGVKMFRAKAVMKYIQSFNFRQQTSGSYMLNPKIQRGYVPFDTALMLSCTHRSWLPVLADRPSNYPACLPWKGTGYTSHFISLNGSLCVSRTNTDSLALMYGSQAFFTERFDLLTFEEPSVHLIAHFKQVIACKDKLTADTMMTIVHAVYTAMLKIVQSGTNMHHLDALRTMREWVYIKKCHKFLSISSVALKQNPGFRHDVEPYLYILPDSISSYSKLFFHFGMNNVITKSQIVSILGLIKREISTSSSTIAPQDVWNTVMAILNWLTENGTVKVDVDSVYVPADSNPSSPVSSTSSLPVLKEPHELVYTDNEFLKEFASASESDHPMTFVHSRINQSLAKCLQITPLSEELDISEDTFEDAGQHEPLIVRLKNILRDYKDGLTIVKELLQNADDAEATEVNICFDARTHTTEQKRLFFPDMCESHGPALIVQNNSTFSDEDFSNIQKLAGATKQSKHLKIGKFGIGFCSVYHITDIPSFVSRERLYIFDPTLKHLRKAVKNPAQPGKRVNYLTKVMKRSKQMEPYEGLFGFDCNSEYNGTMFRLPFRTSPSELSTTCYSSSTIRDLVESIQKCGDKLLLFLQHVRSITVQQIHSGESAPEVLFRLRKPASVNSPLVIVTSHDIINDSKSTNSWLVTKHSTTYQQKAAVASVACLMNSTARGSSVCGDLEGEIFCFLPLSQSTGLPVHVSCNFAVINNRRGIWTSHEAVSSFDPEVQWNVYLMENVIPQAYIELLINLKSMKVNRSVQDYSFHSLWPLASQLQQKNPWQHFVNSFYNMLQLQSLFYSESTSKWLTLQESTFLDPNVLCQSGTLPCVVKVIHHLSLPLVDLPESYRFQLKLSGERLTESDFVNTFFGNLSKLEAITSDRNAVICYILEAYGSQYDSNTVLCQLLHHKFQSYACIPCGSGGKVLRKCFEVVDPKASFAPLFEVSDNRFPIQMLSDRHLVTAALHHAGMMYNSLPWNLVLDRAQSVADLMKADRLKALERVKLILSTMSASGEHPRSGLTIDTIAFLPVMKKPKDYPLEWYGDNHQLLSGRELVLSGTYARFSSDSNVRVAGSQVAFICEELPRNGGCGYINDHKVRELLHLKSSPTLSQVISHLKVLIKQSNLSGQLNKDWMNTTCLKIYQFIEDRLSYDGNASVVISQLQGVPCIWNERKFLPVNSVAINWKLRYGPYLFTAPPVVSSKEKLSKVLGIRDTFTCQDAQRALEMMKTDFKEHPIDKACSELVTEVISIFQKSPEEAKNLNGMLYLPDTNNVLHKSSNLVYNDAPWAPVDEKHICVSSMLSRELATKLGVKPVRSKLLDQYASKKKQHFRGVPFGQHEELTMRIQNIIRDYPFDITVLKELLQNADDAKAKKMYIILDKRTHGKDSVLSEEWQKLQGPALLVWNDSIFTEADLEGIQKLGLGSKRTEAETIGQYGIGFNVVYHLTDCPSFLTNGDTLCVLDPHCRYVPEATEMLPGGRYDDLKQGFWEQFPDMSSAYLQGGLQNLPEELRGGSLFRLPIRHSQDMVKASNIVDPINEKPLTKEELAKFMDECMPHMKKAMFFLNNVTEIKFFVIEEKSTCLQTLFHYQTEMKQSANYDASTKSLSSAVRGFTKQSGCKSCVIQYPITLTEVDCGNKEKSKHERWLIQQGVGDINNENQYWQFVKTAKPKHGIAASLDVPKTGHKRENGQLFCFLPLPLESRVPVHVNGSFVLDSSRRGLWKSSLPDGLDDRSRWNANLFEAIASSYANFLVESRKHYLKSTYKNWMEALNSLHNYYSLFPKFPVTDVTKKWNSLACNVYKILLQSNAEVMCVIASRIGAKGDKLAVEWHPLTSQTLASQVYFWSGTQGPERKVIHPILESIGMKMTPAPAAVMDCFNYIINHQERIILKQQEEQQIVSSPSEGRRKIPSISASSVFEYYTKFSAYATARNPQPCHIANTAFQTEDNYLLFIKFLLGMSLLPPKEGAPAEVPARSVSTIGRVGNTVLSYGRSFMNTFYTSPQPESPNETTTTTTSHQFPASPFSHFLLLTADGILRSFDVDKKIFSSEQEHFTLFPKHLDKFLNSSLRNLNLDHSYFVTPEDEDKERILGVINVIFADSFPPKMHNAKVVPNASTVFQPEKLKAYWKCFANDRVFAAFLSKFLKHWALLLTTDNRLFSSSNEVLPAYPYLPSDDVHYLATKLATEVMKTLDMPFLDITVVVARVNCPRLSDRDRILSNIFHMNAVKPLSSVIINNKRIDFLISYFSVDAKPTDPNWVQQVRSLPFFEDVVGIYRPIANYFRVLTWPNSANKIGYSHWIAENTVFVKEKALWTVLGSANQLSIQTISAERLYTDHIFTNFDKMTEADRYKHLQHIRDCMYSFVKHYSTTKKYNHMADLEKEKIDNAVRFIRNLKTLKCIGPDHSTLQPISAFCDHTVNIFNVFSFKFHILPEQIRKHDWLIFFRELGLKQHLTRPEYLELCHKTAAGEVKNVNKCSDVLLEYLFTDEVKNDSWYKDAYFLQQVSNIAFAHTADTSSVKWIVPGAYQANQLVKLNGAACLSLKHLLWTVRPLIRLPRLCMDALVYIDSITIKTLDALNVIHRAKLATSDVVSNVKKISKDCFYVSESLFNNYPTKILPADKETTSLLGVMFDNLQFLNHSLCSESDNSVIQSLAEFSCIPVYCDLLEQDSKKVVLVKPSCVLSTMVEMKDFHPYLHQIPSEFRRLTSLLDKIGVKHFIEVHHMQIVLEKVYTRSVGMRLDPNAKGHVKLALQKLKKLLSDAKESNSEIPTSSLAPLYLPDTKDELKLSTSMLYGDSTSYFGHIDLHLRNTQYSHFDIIIDQYGMDAVHLCRLLPKQVRPLGMSENCYQVPARECEVVDPSELSLSVQESVRFEDNPLAVVSVFNKVIPSETGEVDLQNVIAVFFSSFSVKTLCNLKTSIYLKQSKEEIGQIKCDFYLDASERGSVLYIDSECDDKDDIFLEIAMHICKMISKSVPEKVPVSMMNEVLKAISKYMKAETPSKKNKVLSKYNCVTRTNYSGHFSLELGEEIPDSYHHRLDQDVHNIFHPMEFVGYEEREGHIKVAQIAHLVNPGANHELEKRYVIYVSKEDVDGKEVSILNLYKFIVAPKKAHATSDSENLSVVPFTSESEAINLRKSLYEGDLADIKKRLLQELREIWKLRPELRNKAVKRLYLKWHPDKNLDDPERAQEIFLFLREQIDILENSVDLPESGAPRSRSGGFGGGFGGHFNQWDRMASRHRASSSWENEQRRENPSSASPFDRVQEDKRPEEGKRWVKQAEIDYRVLCDIHSKASTSLGYGHVCFMAHQVVEKALKGGVYALCGMDGRGLTDHNLTRHAYALQMSKPAQTQSLAQHCSPLESYYLDTRYPNRWPGYTDTPSEHYTSVNADSAKVHAKAVLDIVNDIMPPV